MISKEAILQLDKTDPLGSFKGKFFVKDKGLFYLDGNSLGRLPMETINQIDLFLKDEWGVKLVEGWENWINGAEESGDLLAKSVLGADIGEVLVCDTTSINFYQLCSAVVIANKSRKTIITDAANFPTDRYILEGIAKRFNLKLIIIDNENIDSKEYERLTPELIEPFLSDDVALVSFQVLQYRSGALNPIKQITQLIRQYGALTVWDASHAAGSVKLDLEKNNIDLAVGCTYKYLCAGPGSPAWLYVRKKIQKNLQVPIQGWFAQKDQFEMGGGFIKNPTIRGFQIASPSIVGLRSVNVICKMIKKAGIDLIAEKAQKGTNLMIELYDAWLKDLGFYLMTPRETSKRGGHISLKHKHAKTIRIAVRKYERVIVDYRVPDQIRIAISPLSMSYYELYKGLKKIRDSVKNKNYLKVQSENIDVY